MICMLKNILAYLNLKFFIVSESASNRQHDLGTLSFIKTRRYKSNILFRNWAASKPLRQKFGINFL